MRILSDEEIIKILVKFRDYLDIADWFTGALRSIGWVVIMGLSYAVDLLSKGIKEVYKFMGFLGSEQFVNLLTDYKAISFTLAAVAVAFLGWRIIVLKQVDYSKIITNTLFAITILLVLPWSLNQAEDFINAGKSGNSTTMSQSSKIYKANITDLYAIDEDGWETKNPKKRNYITDDASIDLINILETVDMGGIFKESPLSDDGQDILNMKLINKSDEQEITDLENNFFMDDEAYYRYAWHPIFMMLELGTLALVLFLTMFKTAQLILEMAVVKAYLTTAALTDLESGQRNKKAVEKLRNIVVVLFMLMPLISIYLILTDYVNSLDISSASKLVILLAAGIFVIDGPNFVEELFGVDAGLKSMSRSLMGMYAGAKATGGLAKGIGKGAKSVGKSSKNAVKKGFSRREGERGLDGFKEKKGEQGNNSSTPHKDNDSLNEKKKPLEELVNEHKIAGADHDKHSGGNVGKSKYISLDESLNSLGNMLDSQNDSTEDHTEGNNRMKPSNMNVNTPTHLSEASKRMKNQVEKMQGPISSLPNMLTGEQLSFHDNNALGSLSRQTLNPTNRDDLNGFSFNSSSEVTEPSRNMNNTLKQMQGPIRSPLSFFNVPDLKGENGLNTGGIRNMSPSNYVKSNQDYTRNMPAFYQKANSTMKDQIGSMQGPIFTLPTRLGNESSNPIEQTGSRSQFASGNSGRILEALNRTSAPPINSPMGIVGKSSQQMNTSPRVTPMSASNRDSMTPVNTPNRSIATPISNPVVQVPSSGQKSANSKVAPMSAPNRPIATPISNPGVQMPSGGQQKSVSPIVTPVSAPNRPIAAPISNPGVQMPSGSQKSVNTSVTPVNPPSRPIATPISNPGIQMPSGGQQKSVSPIVTPVSAPNRPITTPISNPGVQVPSGSKQKSVSPIVTPVSAPNRPIATPISNPGVKAESIVQQRNNNPKRVSANDSNKTSNQMRNSIIKKDKNERDDKKQ